MKIYRINDPHPKPGKRKHRWYGKEKAARDAARELAKETEQSGMVEIEACEIKSSGSDLAEVFNGGAPQVKSIESVMLYRGQKNGTA